MLPPFSAQMRKWKFAADAAHCPCGWQRENLRCPLLPSDSVSELCDHKNIVNCGNGRLKVLIRHAHNDI